MFVPNTICAYREARKRDKFMYELATRASDPALQTLLVRCLNEHQKLVRNAQNDPENQELMEKLRAQNNMQQDVKDLIKARAVPDKIDLIPTETVTEKRKRKPVQRFIDEKFDGHGRRVEPEPPEVKRKPKLVLKISTKNGVAGKNKSRALAFLGMISFLTSFCHSNIGLP